MLTFIGVVLLLGVLAFVWSACKVASDADDAMNGVRDALDE